MNDHVRFLIGTLLGGLLNNGYFQQLFHGIPCGVATALAAWCFTASDGSKLPGVSMLPGIKRTQNERAGDDPTNPGVTP